MQQTRGWGITNESGAEIWDAQPIFQSEPTTFDRLKLLFYPKRFVLFGAIERFAQKEIKDRRMRVLDVGCGTGAALIDMQRMWGDEVELYGLEVVKLQVEMAQRRIVELDIHQLGKGPEVLHYDGKTFPFEDGFFDVVYSSDVLGHVENVDTWLSEIARVSNGNSLLAMFTESKLGKHAFMRNKLLKAGINTDPHKDYHISLYSKSELLQKISAAGFSVEQMLSTVWLKFLVHPDELHDELQKQNKFPMLKKLNHWLFVLKQKTRPFSLAVCELYSLVEMLTIGRWVESQGYVVVAKKSKVES